MSWGQRDCRPLQRKDNLQPQFSARCHLIKCCLELLLSLQTNRLELHALFCSPTSVLTGPSLSNDGQKACAIPSVGMGCVGQRHATASGLPCLSFLQTPGVCAPRSVIPPSLASHHVRSGVSGAFPCSYQQAVLAVAVRPPVGWLSQPCLLLLGGHTFPLKPTVPSPCKVVSDHFFLDTGETAVPGQATWGGG